MLIDHLIARAERQGNDRVFTWVGNDGADEDSRDAAALLKRVQTLSGYLRGPCGLRPGDRALLVYPPSLAFIDAFAACLYAGIVPVPAYPPDPRRPGDVARLGRIAESARAHVALTDSRFRWAQRVATVAGVFDRERVAWPDLSWHTTDGVRDGAFPERRHESKQEDVAFLQFTSGSTAAPRGVALTYANLEHQLAFNKRVVYAGEPGRGVFWVPQYHDLGLVSGILSALYGNAQFHIMSPLTFLARPAVWGEVVTRTHATHIAAPHFGYALLLRKSTEEQRRKWDFSHLRVLMSAGEAIQPRVMDDFFAAFAAAGLKKEAWCPAYGLAEHTVGVTIGGRAVLQADRASLEQQKCFRPATHPDDASRTVTLAGCGSAPQDITVRIVNPETRQVLPQGNVGEIWVDSPSKAQAYDGLAEETRDVLHAVPVGGQDGREYLRTGDLGLLHGGELFVTGRLKDLIIVGGRNLSALDVEDAATSADPVIRPGCVAAFAVPDATGATEAVGLAVEVREALADTPARDLAGRVRRAIMAALRVPVRTVVIGTTGLVPKTTSGKLRRQACREALLSGGLTAQKQYLCRSDFEPEVLPEVPPSQEAPVEALPDRLAALPVQERMETLLAVLQTQIATALAIDDPASLEPSRPLAAFGMDSMTLMELADQLSSILNASITLVQLAALPDLRSIATLVLRDVLRLDFIDTTAPAVTTHRPSRCHVPTWRPDVSSRIAVIGAGCAGLVAGYELGKRGYRNVTLFDELNRPGGKVYTVLNDGVPCEMGQLIFGQQYREIFRLALDVGCTFKAEPGTGFAEDKTGGRQPFVRREDPGRYIRRFFEAAGVDPDQPLEPNIESIPEALLVPMNEWVRRHGLEDVPAEVLAVWTGFGYGSFGDDVPAWYFVRCAQIIHFNNMVPMSIAGGNQRMWDGLMSALSERYGFTVSLGTPVTALEHSESGVRLTAGGEAREFDAVIFAIPPAAVARLLPSNEGEPFRRFRHYDYRVSSIESDGLPSDYRSLDFTDRQRSSASGSVLGVARSHQSPRTLIASQYGARSGEAPISDSVLDELLREELDARHIPVERIVDRARWSNYFPHLSVADLGRGTLQQIESKQGRQRTWYLGSYLDFETLEHTARHAQSVIRTFFPEAS